ncbi:MAG: tetratricopeptide repeat protein [Armatimonadota bacterium]|nr:tetratricopeptide repeat protein [Armatimonadota bacterium]
MVAETRALSFLFTDIEGSTKLWERDPEAMKAALAAHDDILRRAIGQGGGRVFKTVGDAFLAVFAAPADAASAAVAGQRALAAHPWSSLGPLRVRMGVHVGPAEERDGDFFGQTLNRTARIVAVAHGGQILLSEASVTAIGEHLPDGLTLRDLGAHRLRDLQRPEHLFQIVGSGLPDGFPSLRSLDALPNNLPRQLTSFIGREREIDELARLVRQSVLVSIVGAGGAGKTRLALQVAAELLEDFGDGVWLVELAPLADPEQVPHAVAATLGVREEAGRAVEDVLVEYLRPRQTLVILDNCEHLIDATAALVETLLRACPRLRIVCTSREALGIPGEVAWRIPSLTMPDPRRLPPLERVGEYEAIRLFVDRASAVAPGFELTADALPAVAAIARRLDGIPLAIELAAARTKVLTPDQIAARLDDRFRLLTGGSRTALPRQQTLRAAMDWSYELLADDERAVLRRLSVFAGGWTLEAAEVICADAGVEATQVLDLQAALVDKSLVVVEDQGGRPRYRLLETVRQYARDKLLEVGEAGAWRTRHRDWFLELAERAATRLQGPTQADALDALSAEHDNLNAAIEWSLGNNEPEAALRMAAALWWYWYLRGYFREGSRWSQDALARATAPTSVRVRALTGAGLLAYAQGDFTRLGGYGEEGLALARELGEPLYAAYCQILLSLDALLRGDYGRAETLARESQDWLQAMEHAWGLATAGLILAEVARLRGRWAQSLATYEQSLLLFREVGDMWGMAMAQRGLGFLARAEGDYERATALHEEGLAMARRLGDRAGIAYATMHLALDEMRMGDYAKAESRLREALAFIREIGDQNGLAYTLYYLGLVVAYQGRNDEAQGLLDESLAIGTATGSPLLIAYAKSGLGRVALHRGDNARAAALASEALAIFRQTGERWGEAVAHYVVGAAAIQERDYATAAVHGEDSLKGFEALRDRWAAGSSQRLLARVAIGRGEYARARALYEEALAGAAQYQERLGVARALNGLAQVAFHEGRLEQAAWLLGVESRLREAIGSPIPQGERDDYARMVEAIRTSLGEVASAGAWQHGAEVPWGEAVAVALAGRAERGAATSPV